MGYILHITVTSVPADDLAHDLAFKDDQMDILHADDRACKGTPL